jgi:fructose-specific phosphotransferase system IIA component
MRDICGAQARTSNGIAQASNRIDGADGVLNLMDILSPDAILAPLRATDKKGVIDELVDVLASGGKVADPRALKEAVWTREQMRTTGIGAGLAIPHGKSPGMPGLAMAIGKPASAMDFEAIDGQPVRLIVLLASPPDRTSDHIQALARISRLMTMEDFRERIYAAATAAEIYELLRSRETTS